MKFVNLFISPSGRINRAKFWIAMLVFTVLNLLSTGMVLAVSGNNTLVIINGIVTLLLAASGILVGIKRLHDRNKSGWWVLLYWVAPFVMLSIGFAGGLPEIAVNIVGFLALAIPTKPPTAWVCYFRVMPRRRRKTQRASGIQSRRGFQPIGFRELGRHLSG